MIYKYWLLVRLSTLKLHDWTLPKTFKLFTLLHPKSHSAQKSHCAPNKSHSAPNTTICFNYHSIPMHLPNISLHLKVLLCMPPIPLYLPYTTVFAIYHWISHKNHCVSPNTAVFPPKYHWIPKLREVKSPSLHSAT